MSEYDERLEMDSPKDEELEGRGYHHSTNFNAKLEPFYRKAAEKVGIEIYITDEVYNVYADRLNDSGLRGLYIPHTATGEQVQELRSIIEQLEAESNKITVDFWQERDRASVVVSRGDTTIAEWWDGQVYDMTEGGFFKFEDKDSVIAYCREVGLLEK